MFKNRYSMNSQMFDDGTVVNHALLSYICILLWSVANIIIKETVNEISSNPKDINYSKRFYKPVFKQNALKESLP